jgi:adenosylhomocysteine nucleosidase
MPIPPEPGALPSILIVAALPEELDHPGVLHTGVGKLNAAYALTRELQRRRPKLVVNYGSAGGLNPSLAGLVEVRRVLQVDMEAEPLAPRGQTDPLLPGPLPARLRHRWGGVRQRRPLRDGGGSLAAPARC